MLFSFSSSAMKASPSSDAFDNFGRRKFVRYGSLALPQSQVRSDHGYPNYSATLETRREIMESASDLVQRFVDASIKGGDSSLQAPAPVMS